MPIIFQQQLSDGAKLALWEITEALSYFEQYKVEARFIAHPEVKKQHLAARVALLSLAPQFSLDKLINNAVGKPYLEGNSWHISFSHTADLAAAIISPVRQVGIDVERVGERIFRVCHKFLSDQEIACLQFATQLNPLQESDTAAKWLTLCWSAKESLYKWKGIPRVDFIKDLRLVKVEPAVSQLLFEVSSYEKPIRVEYKCWDTYVLTWVHG
ncbi:MAG: 4'-phosphopantetheinyl transferase superfamily protein [Bacteroidetes bacterium]|nr:4'-phosphopantetheinyl transferase superfamily protein [Bacteroidota bacterium]